MRKSELILTRFSRSLSSTWSSADWARALCPWSCRGASVVHQTRRRYRRHVARPSTPATGWTGSVQWSSKRRRAARRTRSGRRTGWVDRRTGCRLSPCQVRRCSYRRLLCPASTCTDAVPAVLYGLNTITNPLMGTSSATSNNIKLVHWPLMGGLLHLVLQRGGDWAGHGPRPGPSSL